MSLIELMEYWSTSLKSGASISQLIKELRDKGINPYVINAIMAGINADGSYYRVMPDRQPL